MVGYPDEMAAVSAYMSEREEEARGTSDHPQELRGSGSRQTWGETAPISRGPLSQDIDYKSRADFFPAPSTRQQSSRSDLQGPQLPDPIRGIASTSSNLEEWNDSISRGLRTPKTRIPASQMDRLSNWMENPGSNCGRSVSFATPEDRRESVL
jgi:hypothetical protein